MVNSTAQIVGQSLTLECSVTTVRGITSRVDIMWSRGGVELQRINGTNASFSTDVSTIYTSTFTISQLNTADDDRVYQCEVVINTTPPVMDISNITLDVTGVLFSKLNNYICINLFQFPFLMFL